MLVREDNLLLVVLSLQRSLSKWGRWLTLSILSSLLAGTVVSRPMTKGLSFG